MSQKLKQKVCLINGANNTMFSFTYEERNTQKRKKEAVASLDGVTVSSQCNVCCNVSIFNLFCVTSKTAWEGRAYWLYCNPTPDAFPTVFFFYFNLFSWYPEDLFLVYLVLWVPPLWYPSPGWPLCFYLLHPCVIGCGSIVFYFFSLQSEFFGQLFSVCSSY